VVVEPGGLVVELTRDRRDRRPRLLVDAGEQEGALLGVGDRACEEQASRCQDQQDRDQPSAQGVPQALGNRNA
jgi:hypothetical protein